MKSHTLCVCSVAMLLVSTFASGEIVWDGDYDAYDTGGGGSGSAYYGWSTTTASANGSDNDTWGWGGGGQSYYTTVGANCNWEYEVYVWAESELTLWDGQQCGAGAQAQASVSSPYGSPSLSASTYVSDSGYNGYNPFDQDDGGEPQGLHDSGTDYFGANDGISGSHEAGSGANVPSGSQNTAFSHADGRASCSLSY